MKRVVLGVFFICTPLWAAELPKASPFDQRIQTVAYNAGDVVIIRAMPGVGSRIVFAQDEEIIDVASGFTQGWEFSNRGNVLYIKPRSVKTGSGEDESSLEPTTGKWNTNLMVRTNRRLYDFDLKLLPEKNNAERAAYRVEFRYPEDEHKKAQQADQKSSAKAALGQTAAPRNWSYSMQLGNRSEEIAPTMAYDDGRFTYLKFPNNRAFPAVFAVADDKTESLVNTHVEHDVLVIHRVARQLALRLGNQVVIVHNDQFDMDGIPTKEGSTAPQVKRVIVGEEQ